MKELRSEIRKILEEALKSNSEKGQKIFDALLSAEWPSYESKGFMLSLDEKGRQKLINKLSVDDREKYNEWLRTSEGKKSLEKFKKLNENTIIDKYGDELELDKAWSGFKFPIKSYKTNVKDAVVHIITNEREIGEKDFSNWDDVTAEVKEFFDKNKEANILIEEFEKNNSRVEYCAEKIYNDFLK